MVQMVKNLPAMWKTWVKSLGQEDSMEKGMLTHSSVLAWRIPWTDPTVYVATESDTTERLTLTNICSVQFSSVTQSCPTLCNPMNHSTPGLPVHHQLLEFTQTHVHWVSDAIQPSPPLSSRSPPASNPSQHQSLFQWVNSPHEVAKVLLTFALLHSVLQCQICLLLQVFLDFLL